MSKRFPIPEFEYEQFKNMEWNPPVWVSTQDQARLLEAHKAGDSETCGCYPVQASSAFYDTFKLRGEHRHAVMCVLPNASVTVVGRSHAWARQRVVIVDSLDAADCRVLHEWSTPRPMNTRLGPDDGVNLNGGVVYAVFGHSFADYWIANRIIADNGPNGAAAGRGFRILSASDDDINDFHACNLTFSW